MTIDYGNGTTKYGPGVEIRLTGDDLARAVDLYLSVRGVVVNGPRTISYNGMLLEDTGRVYVDPSGSVFVIHEGRKFDGRGERLAKKGDE